MLEVILFILGLFFGSFLLVLVQRLPRGESVIMNRSHCEQCRHPLVWYDLIPLVSYILLFGKCRYCKKPIGIRYPLVEVITGSMFVITFILLRSMLHFQSFLQLGFYLFLTSCFISIFLTDMWYGIIPDAILFPAIVVSLLLILHPSADGYFLLLNHILAGLGAFGFFLFLFLITQGKGIGFGDVKLAFLVGLLTSVPGVLISLYITFISGAVVSLVLIALGRKKLRGDTIAFGPFLILGAYISLFFGNSMWHFIQTKLFHFI